MSIRKINKVSSNIIDTKRFNFANKKGTPCITYVDNSGSLINTGININNFSKVQKILPIDGAVGEQFGSEVEINGNIAAVGAWPHNGTGAVYVFENSNGFWRQTQKLISSDAVSGDRFGFSIGISGNTIVASGYLDDDTGADSGSAYIFEKSNGTWVQVQKITASDGLATNYFGYSVAIENDIIIVGALLAESLVSNSGAVYIYEKSNGVWPSTETLKITASDAALNDRFGFSVDISDEVIIVGAYQNDDNGSNSGSAYIFEKNGNSWIEIQKITASDAAAGDAFGFDVAIDNGTIAVGSYLNDDNGTSSGSAYIFEKNNGIWTETQKIIASDADAGDFFGIFISISGNYMIIGASSNNDIANDTGSAYIYEKIGGSWVEIKKIIAFDAAQGDTFGRFVNISGNIVIIGSPLDDDIDLGSGSAYIYDNTLDTPAVITDELSVTNFVGDLTFRDKKGEQSITYIDNNGKLAKSGININNFSGEQKIKASDAATNDNFGYSVAIDGNFAVIGSPNDDDNGSSSGSAYIFEKLNGTWEQMQKITAGDAATNNYFGWSVDISGNTIIVGAYLSSGGSAYIFENSNGTWSQVQKITASDSTLGDQFGYSVAIDGDSAIVGSINDNNQTGSAYIYDKSNGVWPSTETQKIIASDGDVFEIFGYSVDISNDIAIVGAYANNLNGSAYIFNKTLGTWPSTETQKITASDGASNDNFGWSVAIDNNTIIVGSNQDDDNGSASGSAYIFDNVDGIWSETQKITASDGAANDNFGNYVAVSDNTIIVGAQFNDDNGSNSGSAYIFEKIESVWVETKKIISSDAATGDQFGFSVAIDENTAIVGSPYNSTNNSGSAYIYNNTLVAPALLSNSFNTGTGPMGGHIVSFSSSQFAAEVDVQLSFGTFADDSYGVTMPVSGKVLYISVSADTNTNITIQLEKNRVLTGDSVSLSSSQVNSTTASTTFVANDSLAFRITAPGIPDQLRTFTGTFWVQYD